MVPFWLAATEVFFSFPESSKSRRVPLGPSLARAVRMWKCESAQSEDSASPRKPKVWRDDRSLYVDNFEVKCFKAMVAR